MLGWRLSLQPLTHFIETSAKKEEGAVKKKEDLKECTEETEQNDTEETEQSNTAEAKRKKVKLKAKRCHCT